MVTEKMVDGKMIVITIKPKMGGFKVWFDDKESMLAIKTTQEKAYFAWCRAFWIDYGLLWDNNPDIVNRVKYGF